VDRIRGGEGLPPRFIHRGHRIASATCSATRWPSRGGTALPI
jgi:hypothetical protein